MLSNVDMKLVSEVCTVVVNSGIELLCCTPYILFVALGAGDEIDDIGRGTS